MFCTWHGVQCSPQFKVVKLILENFHLNGTFSDNTLSRLDQLRVLSLAGNFLYGNVPDLSSLKNLKSLYLDRNSFSGNFPNSLFWLRRLRTIDLSYNNFIGPIPKNITLIDRLYYLKLDGNHFNGSIPALNQSSLKIFNVSKNELSGAVPVTEILSGFDASAFSGNPGLCGEVVRKECPAHLFFHGIAPAPALRGSRQSGQFYGQGLVLPETSKTGLNSKNLHKKRVVVFGLLISACVLIAFVLFLIVSTKRRRRMRQGKILTPETSTEIANVHNSSNYNQNSNVVNSINEVEISNNELIAAATMSEEKVKKLGKSGCLVFCAGEAQIYTLEQLMRGSAELLGKGSVGSTYKAVLDNRLIVSVKRLDGNKMGGVGKEEFERHMEDVGRLRHPNLVPLRAYFQAKEERLLVYDYQANGSLFSLIHGSKSTRAKPLHWTSCLKIAEDIAQGLNYIHQTSRLVHGNIKSSNVLLGADFEACLTDNCLLSLIDPSNGDDDFGYQAPETRKSNKRLTSKSDIYSFGVLLLELLTGKPPLKHTALIATDLPAWVRSVRDDDAKDDERVSMIIEIATSCVRSSPESRPTAWQVLKMIHEVKEVDIEYETVSDSL